MILALAGAYLLSARSSEPQDVLIAKANAKDFVLHEQPSIGLCPWRSQEADQRKFFPMATEVREETLILSGKRLQLAKSLGRTPTSEENAVKIYRLLANGRELGKVSARRARGESGVIELLLAVGSDGAILGAKLQRLREPEDVSRSLQSKHWLGAFVGKTAEAKWRLGQDIPDVSPQARSSAEAILDAAHTLLVLLKAGSDATTGSPQS